MSKEGRGLIGGAKDNGIQSGVLSEIKRNRLKGKKNNQREEKEKHKKKIDPRQNKTRSI